MIDDKTYIMDMAELEDATIKDFEEALVQLRIGPGINEDVSEEYNEATDLAIKLLEREIKTKASPPVKLQIPKTGQWIEEYHYFQHGSAECSYCGKRTSVLGEDTGHGGYTFSYYDYCPNCGAKMVKSEDRE